MYVHGSVGAERQRDAPLGFAVGWERSVNRWTREVLIDYGLGGLGNRNDTTVRDP